MNTTLVTNGSLGETEIAPRLVERVRQLAKESGLFEVEQVRPEATVPGLDTARDLRADAVIEVRGRDGGRMSIIVEVKSTGQPSVVRGAASQLWSMIRRRPDAYGVVGVPFASDESRRVCQEMDVGIVDLAGNCLLRFDGLYVSIGGKPNPYPATRRLVRPFSKRATRGVRVMLCTPRDKWSPTGLAAAANISIGLAYKLLMRLTEMELVENPETGRGSPYILREPERLLKTWASNYSFETSPRQGCYSPDRPESNEERLAHECSARGIRCALTLTSGSARLAAALRYNCAYAYVERNGEEVASALGWKAVPSGANVVLMRPYDEGVFYGTTSERGVEVVCAPQLYVDLASYRGRGEEAAEALLENVLRKQWRAQS